MNVATITADELKAIGEKDFGLQLTNYRLDVDWRRKEGKPLQIPVPELCKNLGRCYNQSGAIVFTDDDTQLYWANAGGNIVERGVHPVLGPWIKYYYRVDSSD